MRQTLEEKLQEAFARSGFPKTDKTFWNCYSSGYRNGAAATMQEVKDFIDHDGSVPNEQSPIARLVKRLVEFLSR